MYVCMYVCMYIYMYTNESKEVVILQKVFVHEQQVVLSKI